ncbi:MAG: SGNH/GDSL hydrolase family protein [Lachnospiraceae bacterium]|nr:SGNH/GDSL hydrolase family protein [Lachnospiraceae bacterium]
MKKEFNLKLKSKTIKLKITPKSVAISIGALVLLTLVILFAIYKITHPEKMRLTEGRHIPCPVVKIQKGNDVAPATLHDVDAVIAYMFDANETDRVFTGNYGIESVILPRNYSSIQKFKAYLTGTLESVPGDDFPHHLVIGIDPYSSFRQSCMSKECFCNNLSFINELAEKHPATAFYIYLPDDNAEKWASFSEDELTQARLSYIFLVRCFEGHPNVFVYYHPYEEWYLYSASIRNGTDNGMVREDIYTSMMYADISDHDLRYMMTPDNVNARMDEVIAMARDYDDIRSEYADLSDKKVIFLGDSIFGNYRNETSVSSFFADMTGATVYNLGVGGRAGINAADPTSDVGIAFNYLLGKENISALEAACKDLPAYSSMRLAGSQLAGTDGDGFIFIMEYGLNDYFGGSLASEYEVALKKLVNGIRSAYPKAEIVLLSPGYLSVFDEGMMIVEEGGDTLPPFREATLAVGAETNVPVLSLTDDFGFTQETTGIYLLGDGVHYNEIGRYRLAQTLARYFK